MATPYLTPDTIPADRACYRLTIPNNREFIGAVKTALLTLIYAFNWEKYGAATQEECSRAALDMYNAFTDDTGWCMIGAIYPYASSSPPTNTLRCDGATYNRVDYPSLYSSLDAVFIIDADTFAVPDLRARNAVGAGATLGSYGSLSVGQTGGEASHTLTTAELASHTHTQAAHAHSEGIAVPTLINGGLEAPAASATPGTSVTGSATPTINNTGGDTPHNNVQPFLALNFCIVAR